MTHTWCGGRNQLASNIVMLRREGECLRYSSGAACAVVMSCAALMYTPPLAWHSRSSCAAHSLCSRPMSALYSALPRSWSQYRGLVTLDERCPGMVGLEDKAPGGTPPHSIRKTNTTAHRDNQAVPLLQYGWDKQLLQSAASLHTYIMAARTAACQRQLRTRWLAMQRL